MRHRNIEKLSAALSVLLLLGTMTTANPRARGHSDHSVEPKLTTAQTPGVVHTCDKDLHNYRCVKKCVVKTTQVGAPLPWYVRYGAASPRRDKKAEDAMLKTLYHQHAIQATVVKTQ
jgi:hypothetical protein